MRYTQQDIQDVKMRAAQLRANLLEMLPAGKTGHLGGSASIAEVTAAPYFKHMRTFAEGQAKYHNSAMSEAEFAQAQEIVKELLREAEQV